MSTKTIHFGIWNHPEKGVGVSWGDDPISLADIKANAEGKQTLLQSFAHTVTVPELAKDQCAATESVAEGTTDQQAQAGPRARIPGLDDLMDTLAGSRRGDPIKVIKATGLQTLSVTLAGTEFVVVGDRVLQRMDSGHLRDVTSNKGKGGFGNILGGGIQDCAAGQELARG